MGNILFLFAIKLHIDFISNINCIAKHLQENQNNKIKTSILARFSFCE